MNHVLPALVLLAVALTPSPAAAADRPNIVLILADDLGWSDTSLRGAKLHDTPNLERLAARGVTFTRAYAASPLCSPTRASILTGQTPARNGSTSPVHHLAEERLSPRVKPRALPGDKARQVESVTRFDRLRTTLDAWQRTLRPPGPERTLHPQDAAFFAEHVDQVRGAESAKGQRRRAAVRP